MNQPTIKKRLVRRAAPPFGGNYRVNNPERGLVGEGVIFNNLLSDVIQWRKANGFPIGLGLEEEIEDEVCRNYPKECDNKDVSVPDGSRMISWRDVLAGTKVMARDFLAGRKRVPREEAVRRAEICSKCSWNQHIQYPCGGSCGELKEFVESVLKTEPLPQYPLKSCGICACYLESAVWIPLELQQSVLSEQEKSKFRSAKQLYSCWKAQGI